MTSLIPLIEPADGLEHLLTTTQHQLSILSTSYADAETKRLLITMRDRLFRAAQKAEGERLKMALSTDIDNETIQCEDAVNNEDRESQVNEAFMTVLLTDISFAWGETIESNNTISLLDVVEDSIYKTFQCICAETKSESIIDMLLISLYETDKAVTIVRSYLQKLGKSGIMKMGQSYHFDNKELNQIKQISKLPTVLLTARRICHSDSYIKVGIKRRRVNRDRSKDHYEQNIWKTPFVYWLVTMVCELQQRKNELCQEIKTNETTVDCIVQATKSCSRIFPRLRNSVYEHAGIAFFLLDSSISTSADSYNDGTKVFLADLTLERVTVALRQDQNIALSLLEYAIGSFSLYNVTARCVEMLFERISIDSTIVIVNACNQLFRCCSLDKENYLKQLTNVLEQSRVDENSSDTPYKLHVDNAEAKKRFRTMEDKDESVHNVLFKIRQPAYPLLVHINLLLLENCDQTIRQAVCLAKHVEDSPHVSDDYKREIYANLFAFFAMHNYFFDESRSVEMSVQVMVVPHLGPIGMDVIFNRLLDLANFIEDCDDGNRVTVGEKYYVSLACQQTVLQSLISKYGHREGWSRYIQEYSESAGTLRPEDVLRKPNPVPESIVCFNPANGKLVPDVYSLLLRGENSQTNQNSSHLALLSEDNEILFSPLAKTKRHDILLSGTAKKVTFNTCNETDVSNESAENEPLHPLPLLEHRKDPLGTIADSIDQTNAVTFDATNSNLLPNHAESTGYARHEDDFIEVEHSFNSENDNEIDEFYDAFDASEENHDTLEECLVEPNEETQNCIDLGSEDSGSEEEASHADDSASASAVDATETATNLNYEERNFEHLEDEEDALDEDEDEIEEDVLDEYEDEIERDEEDVLDEHENEIERDEEDVLDEHEDEIEGDETEGDSVSSSDDEVHDDGDDSGNQDNLPAENDEVVIIDSTDDEESNQSYSEKSCEVSDQNVGSPLVDPTFSGIRRDSSSNFHDENFSQVDAGYDAEDSQGQVDAGYDSQGQATEEDEERNTDSEYNSNTITSSSIKSPLNLCTENYNPSIARASASVDMGYEAEDSQDHTDIEDDRRSKRQGTRFVETGYEAEDSQEQSDDEEVSEAIQSEDDVDNFKSSISPVFPPNANTNENKLESPRRIKNRYSTSDMSADDERTATELEEGGAESSEYDDVVVDAGQSTRRIKRRNKKIQKHYLKSEVEERKSSSLQDYAAAVQRADECQRVSAEQHDIEVGDHVNGADSVLRNADNADVEDAQLLLATSAGVSFAIENSILDGKAANNYLENPSLDQKPEIELEKSAMGGASRVIFAKDSSAYTHFSVPVSTAENDTNSSHRENEITVPRSDEIMQVSGPKLQKDAIHAPKRKLDSTDDLESEDAEAKLDIESNVPLGAEHSSNDVVLIQGAEKEVHKKQMSQSTEEQALRDMECALPQENGSEAIVNLNIEGAATTEVNLLNNSELMSQCSQPPKSETLATGTELETGDNNEIEGSKIVNTNGLDSPEVQTAKQQAELSQSENLDENGIFRVKSAELTDIGPNHQTSHVQKEGIVDLDTNLMVQEDNRLPLIDASPKTAFSDETINLLLPREDIKTMSKDAIGMVDSSNEQNAQQECSDSASPRKRPKIGGFNESETKPEPSERCSIQSPDSTGIDNSVKVIGAVQLAVGVTSDATLISDHNIHSEIATKTKDVIESLIENETQPAQILVAGTANNGKGTIQSDAASLEESAKPTIFAHHTERSATIDVVTSNVDDHSGAQAEEFNDEEASKSSRLSKRKKKITTPSKSNRNTRSTINSLRKASLPEELVIDETAAYDDNMKGVPDSHDKEVSQNLFASHSHEGDTIRKSDETLDQKSVSSRVSNRSRSKSTGKPLLSAARTQLATNTGKDIVVSTIPSHEATTDLDDHSVANSYADNRAAIGTVDHEGALPQPVELHDEETSKSTRRSSRQKKSSNNTPSNSIRSTRSATKTKITAKGSENIPAALFSLDTGSRPEVVVNNSNKESGLANSDDAAFQKSVADSVSNHSWSKSGRFVENTGKDIYVPTNPTHEVASDIDDHSEASSYADKLEHEELHDEEVSKTSRRSNRQKKSSSSAQSNSVRSLRSATKTKRKVLSPDNLDGDKTGTFNENIEAAVYSQETELPKEPVDNHSNKKDAIAKSDSASVQKSVAKKVSSQSRSKPAGKPPLPNHRTRRSVASTVKDVVVPTIPVYKVDSEIENDFEANLHAGNRESLGSKDQEDASLQLDAQHDEEGSKSSRRSNRQKKSSIIALSNSITRSATKTNEDLLPEDSVGEKTAADDDHLETIDTEPPQEPEELHDEETSKSSRRSNRQKKSSSSTPSPSTRSTRSATKIEKRTR